MAPEELQFYDELQESGKVYSFWGISLYSLEYL